MTEQDFVKKYGETPDQMVQGVLANRVFPPGTRADLVAYYHANMSKEVARVSNEWMNGDDPIVRYNRNIDDTDNSWYLGTSLIVGDALRTENLSCHVICESRGPMQDILFREILNRISVVQARERGLSPQVNRMFRTVSFANGSKIQMVDGDRHEQLRGSLFRRAWAAGPGIDMELVQACLGRSSYSNSKQGGFIMPKLLITY